MIYGYLNQQCSNLCPLVNWLAIDLAGKTAMLQNVLICESYYPNYGKYIKLTFTKYTMRDCK